MSLPSSPFIESPADQIPDQANNARIALTASKLRAWGTRSVLSLVDQGFTSAAGFGVNLLLARWMSADIYGAFAVAFAGYLFIAGFHNALLLEPLSVFGPSRYASQLRLYFRAQLSIHAMLVWPLSAIALLSGLVCSRVDPQSPLAGSLVGSGLALPFLLLLWLARRMCYVMQRPSIALLGSSFYLSFTIAGLFVLWHFDQASPFTAFLLTGFGSLFGALILLRQLGINKSGESGGASLVSWRTVLLENWTYGRWLVGSTVLFSIASQIQVFFVSGMLGLGAAGILRAMQLPSLVMTQVTTAAGLLVLPAFAYDFGAGAIRRMKRKAILVSSCLSGFTLASAGLTWIFSGSIENLLFAGKYAPYAWLMPILVLITTAFGPMQGFGMALRAASKPQFDLISNALAALATVLSVYIFTGRWGLAGAVASLGLTFVVQSVVTFVCFLRSSLATKRTTLNS